MFDERFFPQFKIIWQAFSVKPPYNIKFWEPRYTIKLSLVSLHASFVIIEQYEQKKSAVFPFLASHEHQLFYKGLVWRPIMLVLT